MLKGGVLTADYKQKDKMHTTPHGGKDFAYPNNWLDPDPSDWSYPDPDTLDLNTPEVKIDPPTEKEDKKPSTGDSGQTDTGDNNDSGSVICTERYKQGFMDELTFKADSNYGLILQKENKSVYYGYKLLANPIVTLMKKSKAFTHIINFFAASWANEMAFQMGYIEEGSIAGKLIIKLGYPICEIVGENLDEKLDI